MYFNIFSIVNIGQSGRFDWQTSSWAKCGQMWPQNAVHINRKKGSDCYIKRTAIMKNKLKLIKLHNINNNLRRNRINIYFKIFCTIAYKINYTPKMFTCPFWSYIYSILAVANLLAHNNKNQICYCGQISLQSAAVNSSFSDNLTPFGIAFILLFMAHIWTVCALTSMLMRQNSFVRYNSLSRVYICTIKSHKIAMFSRYRRSLIDQSAIAVHFLLIDQSRLENGAHPLLLKTLESLSELPAVLHHGVDSEERSQHIDWWELREGQKHISCPNAHVFLDFWYDQYFVLSLFKFLPEKNCFESATVPLRTNIYRCYLCVHKFE